MYPKTVRIHFSTSCRVYGGDFSSSATNMLYTDKEDLWKLGHSHSDLKKYLESTVLFFQ